MATRVRMVKTFKQLLQQMFRVITKEKFVKTKSPVFPDELV